MPPINPLLITGSMGSGKTTVLSEASDLLTARNIPHASIDVDALPLLVLSAFGGSKRWQTLDG